MIKYLVLFLIILAALFYCFMPRPEIQQLDQHHYRIIIPHNCMAIVNKSTNKVFLCLTPNVENKIKLTAEKLSLTHLRSPQHIYFGGYTYIDTDVLTELSNNEIITKTKNNLLRIAGCINEL